ncbi:MAG TPA: glutamine-hydrolyzing carbamoyl-phosphate synthase small subunit [Methylocella sp.]|nr:glutamine-hydrolyzing carbamoyl-phosphate synthase small subunit [Methylocella sp.]
MTVAKEQDQARPPWMAPRASALLVLADGTVLEGTGFGATGIAAGEVCFNTAMTGYQEILTDPSYADQIICFTFPHIGNVGANEDDVETTNLAAPGKVRGVIVAAPITSASNHRAETGLRTWLEGHGIIGLCGVDTRALTALIREKGMPNAVIAHAPAGDFDTDKLRRLAQEWPGLKGMDLVPHVSASDNYTWAQAGWRPGQGYRTRTSGKYRVVALDYGVKRNILRLLAEADCEVTVVPAATSSEEILSMKPDGVFLSNGPGDPAETGKYAASVIKDIIEHKIPTFGICLGHQMLALAIGARTVKMHQGHHGANHPVKDFTTNKVEIVSMNHGFAVDSASLPANARETHKSLFDGSNCGLELIDYPAFSVQHHPEASPGPRDSHYLFARFVSLMEKAREARTAKR